ncbi:hypothetical protein BH09DEP1_BH09DEP1_8040 [soil metagenome]
MQVIKQLWFLVATISFAIAMDQPPRQSDPSFKITVANQTDYDIGYEFDATKKVSVFSVFGNIKKGLLDKLAMASDKDFVAVLPPNLEAANSPKPSLLLQLKDKDGERHFIFLYTKKKNNTLMVRGILPRLCLANHNGYQTCYYELARYSLPNLSSLMIIVNPDETIQTSATFKKIKAPW